jgi:UDP-glucose 4-epimerase
VRVLDDLSTGRADNLPISVELIVGDVTDPEMAQRAAHGVEAIFHLAAIASVTRSIREWIRAHQVNATGTVVILDAAARSSADQRIPVIYASSAAVYGDNSEIPLAETIAPRPLSPYAVDKLTSELHARAAANIRGVPTVGLRCFNVYGPRQDPRLPYSGVIPIFADRASCGETLTIHGDGKQTRDFVYVRDVVEAFCAAFRYARKEPRGGPVFNVCTGHAVTMKALGEKVGAAWGRSPVFRYDPQRAGDIRHSVGDPRGAATVLGFRADTKLAEGLAKLAAYTRGARARL